MKKLFQAYLVALAAAALILAAGDPLKTQMRLDIPALYWTLEGLLLWTVDGGWFWVLIAWMVYRFTQRRTEAAPPPEPQPQRLPILKLNTFVPPPLQLELPFEPPPVSANRRSDYFLDNFFDYLASKFGR